MPDVDFAGFPLGSAPHAAIARFCFAFRGTYVLTENRFLGSASADMSAAGNRWPTLANGTWCFLAANVTTASWTGGGSVSLDIYRGAGALKLAAVQFASGASGLVSSSTIFGDWTGAIDTCGVRIRGTGAEVTATLDFTATLLIVGRGC